MLNRKIENQLLEWKNSKDKMPLVVKGVRQCGKTYIVQKFAKEHYKHAVYLNFAKNPTLSTAFENSLDVDDIIINLTTLIKGAVFEPHETCLIFDEIQDCPQARTALKFFKMDGRFDVISTGSLLGVKGYGVKKANGEKEVPRSVPVGYEYIIEMHPLDYEEFLWANGITQPVIDKISKCLEDEIPVPTAIHNRLHELLLQYVIVGGMPAAVNAFIETHNMETVKKIQKNIVDEYKDDMVKYASDTDKACIRECFESIPAQLAKENKKFQYSLIKKGSTAARYTGSLQWIEDAGIIVRCYNLSITELPLDGNAIKDIFKVYMADTGLFVSMLEDGTQFDILQGNLFGYKGAVFENLIADIFNKMGRKLYYYHKDSGLEIDFVMRYKGKCTLLEVKANTGNAKSAKTILAHPEKYHVDSVVKLGNYNVGREGPILTLPLYMAFLLRQV